MSLDSALNTDTGEIEEAEELWKKEYVDTSVYRCAGCRIRIVPASYKITNKNRAHFKILPGKDHKKDCGIIEAGRHIKLAKKQKISDERNTLPFPHPSRLVLRDKRNVVVADATKELEHGEPRRPRAKQNSDITNETVARYRREANTIRPICRMFMNFPYDRNIDLEVPGIDGSNYLSCFKKLAWGELVAYPQPKIFYAPVRWNQPRVSETTIKIDLDSGIREGNKLVKGHTLVVDCSDWSKHKRTAVLHEIEVARRKAIELKKKHADAQSFLFFIGEQDSNDPKYFRLSDYRLMCCLEGVMNYPEYR